MAALIQLLVAIEMLLLPPWIGAAVTGGAAGDRRGRWRRVARSPSAALLAAGALLVMAAVAGGDAPVGVLKAQALAVSFGLLVAGLALAGERAAGPRAGQMIGTLLGWLLVAGIFPAGVLAQLAGGPLQAWIVRVAVHANPLVVAMHGLGIGWLQGSLTYRMTPLGESYSYLAGEPSWWATCLAYVFIGSALMVFAPPRTAGQGDSGTATAEGP